MLLTLDPFSQNGFKGPHGHSTLHRSLPTPRSPSPSAPDPPASAAPLRPVKSSMGPSRSGLPPPLSLTLPPPDVGFATMATTTANQQLPPPPAQWQSSEEAMHHWLRAKAEEDRRKQEEERTRQESLRLEQRRVEQSMLRDSLQAGVPPHIIPLIFAGISQGGLPQPILELAQEYLAQSPGACGPTLHAPTPQSRAHTHSQPRRMHARQDSRSVPSNPYAPPLAQHVLPPSPNILLSQNMPPNAGASQNPPSLEGPSTPSGPPDSRAKTSAWVNPSEAAHAQSGPINPGNVQYALGSSVPMTQVQKRPGSQSRRSPPSLYFHHWVPPVQPVSGVPPGKAHQESPFPPSNIRRSEYQTSPGRKRKAPGPHQPSPVPSSRPLESLPSVSQTSWPGSPLSDSSHVRPPGQHRQHSDTSVACGSRSLEHIEVQNTAAPTAAAFPRHTSSLERSRNSPRQEPSGDLSPLRGTGKISQQAPQAPYDSSVTGLRDSDIGSSLPNSPMLGTPLAPTQPRGTTGG